MIIWLIGISGSGKTTIGTALVDRMRWEGRHVIYLDGDKLREVWSDDLGHTLESRRKNHTRFSKLCALLGQDPGVDIVVSALSIFPDLQQWNRENIPGYFQVHLHVDVETAQQRDPKGIYARSKVGQAKDVVGVDFPFPTPYRSDVTLNFEESPCSVDEAVSVIWRSIETARAA